MNIRDAFYHGIHQQIREVLTKMGPERIDAGLTAFETGASNWGACFFARAYPELNLTTAWPEYQLMRVLQLPTSTAIRIVYRTFDEVSLMSKDQLRSFIEAVRDNQRPAEVIALLRAINYKDVEKADLAGSTCQ